MHPKPLFYNAVYFTILVLSQNKLCPVLKNKTPLLSECLVGPFMRINIDGAKDRGRVSSSQNRVYNWLDKYSFTAIYLLSGDQWLKVQENGIVDDHCRDVGINSTKEYHRPDTDNTREMRSSWCACQRYEFCHNLNSLTCSPMNM